MKLKVFEMKTIRLILFFSMLFCGILFCLKWLIDIELKNITYSTLDNVALQEAYNFNSEIENELEHIEILACLASNVNTTSIKDTLSILSSAVEKIPFSKLEIADLQGNSIDTNGEYSNIAHYSFFKDLLSGKAVVSEPYIKGPTNERMFAIAAPIYKNNEITSVLCAYYPVNQINSEFKQSLFRGRGSLYIIDLAGNIIVRDESQDLVVDTDNLFEQFYANLPDELSKIQNDMKNKESGNGIYKVKGVPQYVTYQPLARNDWYMVSVTSDEIVREQATHISRYTLSFTIFFTVIFLLFTTYIVFSQKKHIQQLAKIAFTDTLTGVYNRNKFHILASELLQKTNNKYAFFLFDIDKFKVLNDTLSYKSGDILLKGISNILNENVSKNELFARSDSDEFFALLEYTNEAEVQARVEEIIAQITHNFQSEIDQRYNLVLCVGVYVINDNQEPINNITDKAKHAHRLIKGNESSSIAFYDEKIRNHILAEKNIENKMHDALKNNEFLIYLQPKYVLDDERIYGAEALVRWQSPGAEMIYPDHFIPQFEKNGFVTKLDMYMLEKACLCIRFWIESGITPVPISVNFSKVHLKNQYFVEEIYEIVKKHNINPKLIEIELTEFVMFNNESILIDVLCKLHQHGFLLSMDDFGSGYSSLGMLKNLPVDILKLDRTFFTQYTDLARAKTVIESVISMAKNLGIITVAEGVETIEHIDLLKELGCDIVQGYYYAKPMPLLELNKLLFKQNLADEETQ